MFPQMSFAITLARPALMLNSEAIISLFAGDKTFAHNLQTYLLSKDQLNLKFEFEDGNGKIKVDSIEQQPPVRSPKSSVTWFYNLGMFPQMSFAITLARPALMFNSEAIISLFAGDKTFAHNLQNYLLSKDQLNLKFEFQSGNGKIKVDSIEQQPAGEKS
ncbi:hypothetical protein L6164_020362 [Bauhinia variegata]|uniref:Uncharacterized protein n=1 Tax=Bauhinia variegata TaxID=167791 RepID=A0ACB9MV53_BAUVA|nr:hypothetical protein L6164_020362 [Bauhinia variegata]